jgi:hypothetical protein
MQSYSLGFSQLSNAQKGPENAPQEMHFSCIGANEIEINT